MICILEMRVLMASRKMFGVVHAGLVLPLGYHIHILVKNTIRVFFFFFFIPHIKLANKMSRFQWTSGLWRQLWEMNCAKLYHVCAILMSAGELTNAAFKARTTQMSKHWEVYIWNKNVVFTLKTRICFQRRNSSAACLLFSARAGIVTVNSFTVESNICYQSMI